MRAWFTALSVAAALVFSGGGPVAAQTEEPYDGPKSVSFDSGGMMAFTKGSSVDLVTGVANLTGPCRPCGPKDHRQIVLAPQVLIELRMLAVEIDNEGLFVNNCVVQQRIKDQIESERKQTLVDEGGKYWSRKHPGSKMPFPIIIDIPSVPTDPFFNILRVDGVGEVKSGTFYDYGVRRMNCNTWATELLWQRLREL